MQDPCLLCCLRVVCRSHDGECVEDLIPARSVKYAYNFSRANLPQAKLSATSVSLSCFSNTNDSIISC